MSHGSTVPHVNNCRVVYHKLFRVINFTEQVRPDQKGTQNSTDTVYELGELEERRTGLLPHLDQNHIVRIIPSTYTKTVDENTHIQVPYRCRVWHEDRGQAL